MKSKNLKSQNHAYFKLINNFHILVYILQCSFMTRIYESIKVPEFTILFTGFQTS